MSPHALKRVCLYTEDTVTLLARTFVGQLMEGKKEGGREGGREGESYCLVKSELG